MSNQDVIDFVSAGVAQGMELDKIAESMTETCLAKDSMAGIGCDNMTVLIIGFFTSESKKEWIDKISNRVGKLELTGGLFRGSGGGIDIQ